MQDILIGAIQNYKPEQIRNWVESLNQVGFNGKKVVISYGVPEDTITYLFNNNFEIIESQLLSGEFIHNRRFLDIWTYLTQSKEIYRYVITTDIRDVIFQYDPSIWLMDNIYHSGYKIIAPSENINIENEEWNNKNVYLNYPHIHPETKYCDAYNVGTIAGEFREFRDFCLLLYHFITTKQSGENYADQAAFNCLVNMNLFDKIIKRINQNDAWCCQLGTTLSPESFDKYKDYWLEEIPSYDVSGRVYTNTGEPFCLVHQYDRVPILKDLIHEKYN